MSSGEYAGLAGVRGDLQAAKRARLAANTPPPYPSWWAPVAAVTHGLGLTLALGPFPYGSGGATWRLAVAIAGIAALAVFPVMCAVRVTRMRVRAWPPGGTTRQRMFLEGAPLVAYGLAGLAFLAFGRGVGAIVLGVLAGGSLWWRETRKNKLSAESAATLAALGRTE